MEPQRMAMIKKGNASMRVETLLFLSLAVACQHDAAPTDSHAPAPATARCSSGRLEIKFHDGSGVRLRDGKLVVVAEASDHHTPEQQLASALALVNGPAFKHLESVQGTNEAELDRQRATGQANTGQPLPDLNLWFFAELADIARADELTATLGKSAAVEHAYCAPSPAPLP
jgi:hypothetical protein